MTNQSGEYVEWGPELQPAYGENIVVALVRDPDCLVFYWDAAAEHGGKTLVARVQCLTSGTHFDMDLPDTRAAWHLPVESNHTYRIDLLCREADGTLHRLATSSEVSFPVRHAWQSSRKPAEVHHSERHPIARSGKPGGDPATAWPPSQSVPRPQEPEAPQRTRRDRYPQFGEEQ